MSEEQPERTALDELVERTDNRAEEGLPALSQDPGCVPASVVDENGDPV